MGEKVARLMRRGAITCRAEASIRDVAQIMAVNSAHYCVVINNQHEVLGIISSRSILKAFGRDLDQTMAKDILLPYTFTITPNDPIEVAIHLMNRRKIEHVVVTMGLTGNRTVFGMLHAEDIVDKMTQN
jgi:signal-transduction protein with cAMP-binding, CBS, and nucleotidyltransferase domain